jgi:hypothetical protein
MYWTDLPGQSSAPICEHERHTVAQLRVGNDGLAVELACLLRGMVGGSASQL